MIKFIKQQYIFLFCLLIALLFTSNLATWAYDPAIGSGAGAVQSQLEQQLINDAIEKEFIQKDFTPKKKKEGFSEKLKKTSPDAKRQDLEYDPNFILNRVIFEGNTIYKDEELQSIAFELIGEEIHIDDMINLAEIVTRKYHYDGYITSYAFLPEQDVVNGVVTIKIIESKVSEINIDGNKWNRDWYFKSDMFNPSRLKQGSVFNVAKVDSVIKIMNDKPDIKGNIYVSKNAKENTEINLDVKDRFPIKFNVAYDDHGRESVGLQRARMLLSNDNLTGFGDKIYGGLVLASRTTGVLAGYQIPVSKYGTKLAFDYGYTNVRPGEDLSPYSITGKSSTYSLRLVQPILKTSDTDVEASLGIDFSNTASNSAVFGNLTDYSLRVLRGNVYAVHDDSTGRSLAALNAGLGLDGLGAKAAGDIPLNFFKVALNLIRLQRIPKAKESYFVFRLGGQYSPNNLYPIEQMQLGGYNSVRGYETGTLLGDYGFNGSVELRTPVPGLKAILPEKYKEESKRIKLLAFYDFGYLKNHGDIYGYTQNFLQSVGCGVNIVLPYDIVLNMAVGIPVGQKDYINGNARLHFSLSTSVDQLLFHKFSKENL